MFLSGSEEPSVELRQRRVSHEHVLKIHRRPPHRPARPVVVWMVTIISKAYQGALVVAGAASQQQAVQDPSLVLLPPHRRQDLSDTVAMEALLQLRQ